eukprot:UN08965
MDISFLKQSSIYQSMLGFLKHKHATTELRVVQITCLTKYAEEIANYTEFYQKDFMQYEWVVYAHISDITDNVNKGSGIDQVKQAAHLRIEAIRNLPYNMAQAIKSMY